MQILLNKKIHELPEGSTLSDLIRLLQIETPSFAVEWNQEIVPKTRLQEIILKPNDEVILVSFVGGG